MPKYLKNAVLLAKNLLKEVIEEGDVVVDGTLGNGNDTLYLAKLVGESGKVVGFDVQEVAISNSKDRLDKHNIHNCELVLDGHQNMDKYISEDVSAVMFNLGYLPKADHSITTLYDNTIIAIKKGLNLLKKNGIMTIAIYSGHPEGMNEKINLLKDLENFDQRMVNVLKMDFINQKNEPPILVALEKKVDGTIFDI